MSNLNGIVEDIGGVIGYTATCALVDWFGGANLYVPNEATDAHPIAQVIGMPAMRRLVQEWGGQTLWLQLGYQREQDRRDRFIAVLLGLGMTKKTIAAIAGMSERHVHYTRLRLEQMGLLPMILKKAGLEYGAIASAEAMKAAQAQLRINNDRKARSTLLKSAAKNQGKDRDQLPALLSGNTGAKNQGKDRGEMPGKVLGKDRGHNAGVLADVGRHKRRIKRAW